MLDHLADLPQEAERARLGLRKESIVRRQILARIALISLLLTAPTWADEPSTDVKSIADGGNAFACDLYAKLAATPGNLFFSPYSISSALAMTYAGARGQTATQMASVLHFSLPDERLHAAFGELSDELNSGGTLRGKTVYQMAIANALWGQSGYPYNPAFIELLKQDYGAELNQANFISAAESARLEINGWVAKKTDDKITDLLPPGSLSSSHAVTRLVLVNAIYFKGSWAQQFPKENTLEQSFHLDRETSVSVPMMYEQDTFLGMENDEYQAVELPYVGHRLEMVVLLPREIDGLAKLEAKATPENIAQWMDQLAEHRVELYLPKFNMEYKRELSGVLAGLGMEDAFSPPSADFSGIESVESLFISKVFHQAFVHVNEEGTEAAAATGIAMMHATFAMPEPPPMVFRADHPFLFLIREDTSGAILFMGRVANPKE
jgi:serpin B